MTTAKMIEEIERAQNGDPNYVFVTTAQWKQLRAALAAREGFVLVPREPVAWRREYDGDISDLGQWVYIENADDRDHYGVWEPLYAAPSENEHG